MNHIKKIISAMILTCSLVYAQIGLSAEENAALKKEPGKFYTVEDNILQMRREINQLKEEVAIYKQQVNMPKIREEIKTMIKIPVMTHQIQLTNGTVVKGSILSENKNLIVVQTQIGEITLTRDKIRSIEELDMGNPILTIKGAVEEQTYNDKKIFIGDLVNNGQRRADFVRIIFYLYDDKTNLIATDSTFVIGSEIEYISGIRSTSMIPTGSSGNFRCIVPTNNIPVSYYTTKIHYTSFD